MILQEKKYVLDEKEIVPRSAKVDEAQMLMMEPMRMMF